MSGTAAALATLATSFPGLEILSNDGWALASWQLAQTELLPAQPAQPCSVRHIRPRPYVPPAPFGGPILRGRIAGRIYAPYRSRKPVPAPRPAGVRFGIRTAGQLVDVAATGRASFGPLPGSSTRGTIGYWSPRSRRRLLRSTAALGLPSLSAARPESRWLMLTLTYATDPGAVAARRNRAAFFRRLQRRARRFGSVPVVIWKREFQARGVPHDHLLCLLPGASSKAGLRAWRQWCWEAWAAVVDDGARHRVDLIPWASRRGGPDLARYFVAYATTRKGYQHRLPPGWDEPGRWWGICGARPSWTLRELNLSQFIAFRRLLRRLYHARSGRNLRTPSLAGCYYVASTEQPPAAILALVPT